MSTQKKNVNRRMYACVCLCTCIHMQKCCRCLSPLQFVVANVIARLIRHLMCQWVGRKSTRAGVWWNVWNDAWKQLSRWAAEVSTLCPWLCCIQAYMFIWDGMCVLLACWHNSVSLSSHRPLYISRWLSEVFKCG